MTAFSDAAGVECSRQKWKMEMRPLAATAETSGGSVGSREFGTTGDIRRLEEGELSFP
jgi:hypothetical protein